MSARLTHMILETVTGNPVHRKPEPPHEEYRPLPRLIVKHRFQEFRPHGTDSVGVIVSSWKQNRRSVQFYYKHDPDTIHSMLAHEFNERFASFIPMRRQLHPAVLAALGNPATPHMMKKRSAA